MNTKTQKLANSLQKVLGSAENDEDFFDVTSADEESSIDETSEEVEEITEDEVKDAMDEEESVEEENEESDDVETEISIDEGEEIEETSEDEVSDSDDNDEDDESADVTMDEETGEEIENVEDDEDEVSDDDDFNDNDEEVSEEISEDDVVEVDDVEEVSDDDYSSSEEDDIVEVDNVEEVSDDDIDDASEEISEELEVEDDESSEDESIEEITDEDLIESGEVEEITDEDIENADVGEEDEAESSADNIVVDETATGSASELLASRGFQFETDACGRLCVTGCDETENNIEVVEDVPDDIQVAPSDVNLVLHESASEDPFYSVLIKGKPVASIHLKDQEKSEDEDKRGFFISSEYPKALTDAMVKGGVNPVLDSVNAKRFVASVKTSAVAEEMKKQAKLEMESEVKAAVVEMKDKFIECVKLAIAGMNKNFFTNVNDFKGAVYDAFAAFGANHDVASRETEKVFANSDSFFASVVDKAQELMGFDENSFKTVASAVSNSGVGHREVETFESKLMQGNNPVVAGFEKQEQQVTASAVSKKRLVFKKHIG